MPYGSMNTRDNEQKLVRTNFIQYNGYSADYTYDLGTNYKPMSGVRNYSRSGSNNNVPFRSLTCRKDGGKWITPPRWVRLPDAINSRMYFDRKSKSLKYAKVKGKYLFVPGVPRPKTKRPKLINAKVNALNYVGCQVDFAGNNVAINFKTSPGTANENNYNFYGNLWRGVYRVGPTLNTVLSGAPNAQSFLAATFVIDTAKEIELDAAALGKLYSNAKNQSVNLLQFLAERRQVIDMFVTAATRAAKVLLHIKALRFQAAIRTLVGASTKSAASDLLMLRYGLQPLCSDIEGIVKELVIPEELEFSVRGRKKHDYPPVITEYPFNNSMGIAGKVVITQSGSVEIKYVTRVKVTSVTRDASRLGFTNLNSVAWELIPFSFIFDWFLPVGSYLNNLDAFASLSVLSTHKTVVRKTTTTYMCHFGGSLLGTKTSSGVSGFVNESFSCVRTIPLIVPKLGWPSFKNPLSAVHIQNALALFVQLRK